MNVLEKILEEMLNYERVVKNDEDLEWNRAMYKCSEIIRSHMDEATVSKMENVQADGWIPVEERLPEDDNFVLVTVSGIYNHLTAFSDALRLASYTEDGGWFIESYPEWDDPNVTAWRPLPEPYKPEGGEDEMKNIDHIKTMNEEELVELLYNRPFDCTKRCKDYGYGCLITCTHDDGREFIRAWLNEEKLRIGK